MQIHVQADYNYLLEAKALAVKLFKRQAGEEVRLVERHHLFLHDGIDVETRFAEYKGFLERVFAQGQPLVSQFAELCPLFVGKREKGGIIEGLLSEIPFTSMEECSLADFQRALRLALYQIDLALRDAMPDPAQLERVMSQNLHFSEAFRIVEASEMDADQKLLLLKLIQNSTPYFEQVRDFLGGLEVIIRKEVPALDSYRQDFLQAVDEKGAEMFLQEAVGDYLRLEEMDFQFKRPLTVFPAAVNYNDVSLRIPLDQRIGIPMCLGLLFHPLTRLKQRAARQQDIFLGQLKAISDPTRFEVLRLLAERSRYTKELAEHLNLSSSTLSHHMALLVEEELVSFQLKGRRSYYSLRVAELIKLAEMLQALAKQAASASLAD